MSALGWCFGSYLVFDCCVCLFGFGDCVCLLVLFSWLFVIIV